MLKLSDRAYEQYTTSLKKNRRICRDQATRKMIRNRELALPMNKTWDGKGIIYSYGAMRFMVRDNVVVWIENGHRELPMWYKDKEKYHKLNRQLGIR